ncbi:hypothetical protein NYQ83_03860 [Afifella sp. JA880]|uniref:hypothetical protein n=1 Tax=Afifella sp. JA880 TaxID=2975280 RepID=UPI0021BBB66B|nr:hypothetical protein [Afifella sp. JA880]MCT8266399.1 hypothetical protein [Afifella sp. JA880]
MLDDAYNPARSAVFEEIRRVVAEAIESGICVDTGRQAERIDRIWPQSGLSADDIASALSEAAVSARITVKMSRPRPSPH